MKFVSAIVGRPNMDKRTVVSGDLTLWTANAIPSIRTVTIRKPARNAYWRWLDEVVRRCAEEGIGEDAIEVHTTVGIGPTKLTDFRR